MDEDLGTPRVAAALVAAGASVELHTAHFARGTPDAVWLEGVGQRGWILLTKDKHIRYRLNEVEALRHASVRAFVLASGNLTGPEMGATFARAFPKMQRLLRQHRGPFIAHVRRGGVVTLMTGK